MIDLVLNTQTDDKKYDRKFFYGLLETAVHEVIPFVDKISVSINLVGTSRIKDLNKKYRGKNKITDVLSFPIHSAKDFRNSDSFNGIRKEVDIGKEKHAIMDLGDIFICLPVIKKEAKREHLSKGGFLNNPAKDEKAVEEILRHKLAQMTVHGFLHLLGYDHHSPEEENEMFGLQDKIINNIVL